MADDDLARRLRVLKGSPAELPTDEALAARLQAMKGTAAPVSDEALAARLQSLGGADLSTLGPKPGAVRPDAKDGVDGDVSRGSDRKLGGVMDAFLSGGTGEAGGADVDEVELLLQMNADRARLQGKAGSDASALPQAGASDEVERLLQMSRDAVSLAGSTAASAQDAEAELLMRAAAEGGGGGGSGGGSSSGPLCSRGAQERAAREAAQLGSGGAAEMMLREARAATKHAAPLPAGGRLGWLPTRRRGGAQTSLPAASLPAWGVDGDGGDGGGESDVDEDEVAEAERLLEELMAAGQVSGREEEEEAAAAAAAAAAAFGGRLVTGHRMRLVRRREELDRGTMGATLSPSPAWRCVCRARPRWRGFGRCCSLQTRMACRRFPSPHPHPPRPPPPHDGTAARRRRGREALRTCVARASWRTKALSWRGGA